MIIVIIIIQNSDLLEENYPSQGPQQTLFFQLALIQNLFPEIGDGNDSSDGVGADDDCDDGW